jgi:NADH dehydrogenase
MRILVTGGTGVVGRGVIPELLAAGHQVRLLSRGAEGEAKEWPAHVECISGDVTNADSIEGAADGCEAVVHITGIVDEKPPETTFEKVNVEGTRHVLGEAERAGVRRFVFISSLGADRGRSPYHQSKLKAEELVRRFSGEWIITRPGHVFGPGDEMISTVLKMVRASPVVPEVGFGQHRFQPLWFKDFGQGLRECVHRPDVTRQILEVAGGEVVTVSELLERLSSLTRRPAFPLPLPAFLVQGAVWAFERGKRWLSWKAELPLNESKLTMLVEENVIANGRPNALTETFRIQPTPLDQALKELTDSLPENPPETGVGSLERKRFWADIAQSRLDAEGLMSLFKKRITEVMPINFSAEPGAPHQVEDGATMSMRLTGRGNVQVRVQACDASRVSLSTIEGHPLAGMVSFFSEHRGPELRFTVETISRPANTVDWVAVNFAGRWLQDRTWQKVVGNMVEFSGGSAPGGIQHRAETLEGDEAKEVEQAVSDLIARRRRERVETEVAAKS